MKNTSGPWNIKKANINRIAPTDEVFIVTGTHGHIVCLTETLTEESRHNAALISACPDMLIILKKISDYYFRNGDSKQNDLILEIDNLLKKVEE